MYSLIRHSYNAIIDVFQASIVRVGVQRIGRAIIHHLLFVGIVIQNTIAATPITAYINDVVDNSVIRKQLQTHETVVWVVGGNGHCSYVTL